MTVAGGSFLRVAGGSFFQGQLAEACDDFSDRYQNTAAYAIHTYAYIYIYPHTAVYRRRIGAGGFGDVYMTSIDTTLKKLRPPGACKGK